MSESSLHLIHQCADARIYLARLDDADATRRYGEHLSRSERARGARFRFETHRRRFIVGRGLLRELLGLHLGQTPDSIEIVEGQGRKPLLGGPAASAMDFNVSHADDVMLVALSTTGDIGVDVEARPAPVEIDALVADHFSAIEQAEYEALPLAQRESAFLCGWTRKEAVLKAMGLGLAGNLDSFDVLLDPSKPAALLRPPPDTARHVAWQLAGFLPVKGYVAAWAHRRPSQPGAMRPTEGHTAIRHRLPHVQAGRTEL